MSLKSPRRVRKSNRGIFAHIYKATPAGHCRAQDSIFFLRPPKFFFGADLCAVSGVAFRS
jgi:hypothetical protein